MNPIGESTTIQPQTSNDAGELAALTQPSVRNRRGWIPVKHPSAECQIADIFLSQEYDTHPAFKTLRWRATYQPNEINNLEQRLLAHITDLAGIGGTNNSFFDSKNSDVFQRCDCSKTDKGSPFAGYSIETLGDPERRNPIEITIRIEAPLIFSLRTLEILLANNTQTSNHPTPSTSELERTLSLINKSVPELLVDAIDYSARRSERRVVQS